MRTFVRTMSYSFPVRLLALHFRSHLLLVTLWLLLGLLVTGRAGRFFGVHYIMLTPEYQGKVDFLSFLLTGVAFGAFFMIWQLTTYLLCADRFPFLATLSAPFTKFSLNNSLIPVAFLLAYLSAGIWFQAHDEFTKASDIVVNMCGFLLGAVVFIFLLAAYLHYTNKDIAAFLRPGKFVPRPGGRLLIAGKRIPTVGEIKAGTTRWRVDTYLTERCKIRIVRSAAHYDPMLLSRVFKQNHTNAITVQIVALVLLMLQGYFMEVSWMRFPTSVSVFVLLSIIMAMFGAITFWFRQWGTLVFLGLLLVVNSLTGKGYFQYRNHAYGLNYNKNLRPEYNYKLLEALCTDSVQRIDKAATEVILNNWLAKNTLHSPNTKPKMVLVCSSGGGHRAAIWTMRVLQKADAVTNGKLLRQTVLFTGASGGMLGAAYLREIMLRQAQGERISVRDSLFLDDLGQDLLNPVTSSLVSNDLFFPLNTFQQSGQTYRKDRGYYFESQFNQNLRGYMGRKLADYYQPEHDAVIPMMMLSPYILNDSRRLWISPQGVSYMSIPPDHGRYSLQAEVDGVDFRRLFAAQQADSLSFTTALRMNCTFPFILPNTWLPTRPALEIMDAGARDNFGISGAVRFAQVFKDWIRENTSGVLIVQVRCWEKIEALSSSDEKGILDDMLTPAGAAANLTVLQDFEHDQLLSMLDDLLGGNRLEVVRFTYRPVRKQREASLSLHLSKRERIDLREAYYQPANQASIGLLKSALK